MLNAALASEETASHAGARVASAKGFDVIDCRCCGFRHVMPLPDADALEDVYSEEYYTQEKPAYLVRAGEDERWACLGYDDQLALLSDHLGASPRRLLDIGSGPGLFLSQARAQGWSVEGIEPSRQAAAYARDLGLTIHNAFFTGALASRIEPFPAIRMINVIEHIPDPIAFVGRAAALLPVGGAMLVGVPNDFNPLQTMLEETRGFSPWWIAPPHHLNYLDFDSLERLLVRAGLTPMARLTSFPMELFLALGENYIGNDALGRACHVKRKTLDLDLEAARPGARRALYTALAAAGIGREAIVIAKKTKAQP